MTTLGSCGEVVRLTAFMASMRDGGADLVGQINLPGAGLATHLWLITIDQALGGLMQMTSAQAQAWVLNLCQAMPPDNPMYLGHAAGVFF